MFLNIIEKVKNEKFNLKTDSNIVKSWSNKFDVPNEYIVIAWKTAICDFLQNGKKGCHPSNSDYPIVVNIFKAIMKKWLSQLDDRIKYLIKNPTIDGEKAEIHYNEAKGIALKEKIKEYKDKLKECCKNCSDICSK